MQVNASVRISNKHDIVTSVVEKLRLEYIHVLHGQRTSDFKENGQSENTELKALFLQTIRCL